MEALFVVVFCVAICATFLAGWAIALVITAIHAKMTGRSVKDAIKPFVEEL